jgi:hypothetical protein
VLDVIAYLRPWQAMFLLKGIHQIAYGLHPIKKTIINQAFRRNEINPWASIIVEEEPELFPSHAYSVDETKRHPL